MTALIFTLMFSAQAETTPFRSHSKLVSANGRGVLVFDGENESNAVLNRFSDRIYKQKSAADDEVRDLLYDSYFGIDGVWLTQNLGSGYQPTGSGLMSIKRRDDENFVITEWAWTPMELNHPGYAHMLEIRNKATEGEPKTFVVNSLHNVNVGDWVEEREQFIGREQIWSDGQNLVEMGVETKLGMWFQTTRTTSSYTCDRAFESAGAFDGRCGTEVEPWGPEEGSWGPEQVGGFEWTVEVGPEETVWVDVTAMFFSGGDTSELEEKRATWIDVIEPDKWTLREGNGFWKPFHDSIMRPASASDEEYGVFKQGLTFLKMAQVTEDGPAFGQIPASFPVAAESDTFSNTWNITWVRDQAYAAVALARAGKLDEAAAALAFTLQDKAGGYVDEVGMDYGLSVCRTYGDGSEWSDDDGTGPNIELDNFGLTLWAIAEYVNAGGDASFIDDYNVLEAVADPLLNAIDDLNLIQPDSSIWERHWYGNEKHFTYTTAMAIAGLDAIGELADEPAYENGARRLEVGLCEELVDENLGLLGNAEEEPEFAIDLAAVEAFNHGVLDAQGPTAINTLSTWEDRLAVANGMGFKRNDDGDLYDNQEWVVMDLRLAEAYRRSCDLDKAKAIEEWITLQAYYNLWTIPELMDAETGDYLGPAPMLGFGAGAYILGLYNREAAALDCSTGIAQTCADILAADADDDTGTGSDDGGSGSGTGGPGGTSDGDDASDDTGIDDDSKDKGCGCSTTKAANIWLAIPLLALALSRRRQIVTVK